MDIYVSGRRNHYSSLHLLGISECAKGGFFDSDLADHPVFHGSNGSLSLRGIAEGLGGSDSPVDAQEQAIAFVHKAH